MISNTYVEPNQDCDHDNDNDDDDNDDNDDKGVKVHSGEKFTFPAAGGKF